MLERDLIVSAEFREQIKTHERAKPHLAGSPKQWGELGSGANSFSVLRAKATQLIRIVKRGQACRHG